MKHVVARGQTDYTVLVWLGDSSSTTGEGITGIVAADLTAYYARVETDNDVTSTIINLSDLAALTDAHTDGGWFEVSAANQPGLYRLDLPDGVFAAGAWSAAVTLVDSGANDIAPSNLEFQLEPVAVDIPAIADAVWDELIAGHLGAGTTGAALNAAGAAGDPWLTALPGAYATGTAGYIIGNCATNIVNYISSHVSAIGNLLRRRSPDLGCLYRGDTWTETIGGLGDLSTATNIWLAIKKDSDDPDTASMLLISIDVGLEVTNQAPAGALLAAHGSIAITAPATGGFIDVYVHQDEMAKLEPAKYYFDIQVETPYGAGSRIDTKRAGHVVIEGDIVRTTT
jgi:hypothetical protein